MQKVPSPPPPSPAVFVAGSPKTIKGILVCPAEKGLPRDQREPNRLRVGQGGGFTRTDVLRRWLIASLLILVPGWVNGADLSSGQAQKLLRVGLELSEKTHYLEALDLLEEARDVLEDAGITQTALYGDVLYSLAETRIKGRLHQSFPAQYVKFALKEAQQGNRVRERLADLPPRKFAEGYFVEGYIQKKFFKRTGEALACFEKAVSIDPGFAAAKRELGELILSRDPKKPEN